MRKGLADIYEDSQILGQDAVWCCQNRHSALWIDRQILICPLFTRPEVDLYGCIFRPCLFKGDMRGQGAGIQCIKKRYMVQASFDELTSRCPELPSSSYCVGLAFSRGWVSLPITPVFVSMGASEYQLEEAGSHFDCPPAIFLYEDV